MKKQKRLSLKKSKIAAVDTLYAIRGGGTESCEDVTCYSVACAPDHTHRDECNTSNTTVHTRADSETCGVPRTSLSKEIC